MRKFARRLGIAVRSGYSLGILVNINIEKRTIAFLLLNRKTKSDMVLQRNPSLNQRKEVGWPFLRRSLPSCLLSSSPSSFYRVFFLLGSFLSQQDSTSTYEVSPANQTGLNSSSSGSRRGNNLPFKLLDSSKLFAVDHK